jgi:predicted RNase H-like nuclease (RuvC/YqgF family)
MSEYPECRHGHHDPNSYCAECETEDKIASLRTELWALREEVKRLKEEASAMKEMLCRIAYPRRGSDDERANIEHFADEIQRKWSVEFLLG